MYYSKDYLLTLNRILKTKCRPLLGLKSFFTYYSYFSVVHLCPFSVTSCVGTPDFVWREESPNSDHKTRVLSLKTGEEKRENLVDLIKWIHEREDTLSDGFDVEFAGNTYTFIPSYKTRQDKKACRQMTGQGAVF